MQIDLFKGYFLSFQDPCIKWLLIRTNCMVKGDAFAMVMM